MHMRLKEMDHAACESGSPRPGSREFDAVCAALVRQLDIKGDGELSLRGLHAAIKR